MKQRLNIKEITEGCFPEVIKKGDWVDLKTASEATFHAGEYAKLPLGIAVELPKGYEAHMAPRSSTFEKYGLLMANSFGIIDESFKGDGDEWQFPAYATEDVHIDAGTKICQFRIIEHQPELELVKVDTLGNPDRGGFGSTGS